ncbi:hypothetical protein BGZ75_001223, partial [Mortierella antarctica]
PNREAAERLIRSHGTQWPSACPNPNCAQPYPRNWYKNVVTDTTHRYRTRVFRCVCKGETASVRTVMEILGPIAAAPPSAPRAARRASHVLVPATQSPGTRVTQPSMTLSELDPATTDAASAFETDDEDDDVRQEQEYYSPLLYGPSQRPFHYQTPPPATYSPAFSSFPSGYQWTPVAQQQWPTQISSFPMSPNAILQASPAPQSAAARASPAPQRSQSQVPDSPLLRNRKRGALVQSTWQDKQPRSQTVEDVAQARAEAYALHQENQQQAAFIQQLQGENSSLKQQLSATQDLLQKHEDSLTSLHQAVQALQAEKNAPQAPASVDPRPRHARAAAAAPAAPVSAPAGPAPVSYASATRNGLTAEQLEVIKAMKPAPRPFRARRDQPLSDANTPTVRVYFGNMQSCPLGLLKTRLRALRIRTSAIPNFAFVGKSVCELLVEASYKDELITKMEQFTFRHLPNYDPAVPQDPNVTEDVRIRLQEAYATRLRKTAGTTTRPVVRQVFLQMMNAANIPVPEDLADNTVIAAVPETTEEMPLVPAEAATTTTDPEEAARDQQPNSE